MSRGSRTEHIEEGSYGFVVKGQCRCPNCGYTEPYQIAVPCYSKACPKCGAPMTKA